MKWGEGLFPGAIVDVWESSFTGFIVKRDPEHLHLWHVLHENSISTFHTSKLRISQA